MADSASRRVLLVAGWLIPPDTLIGGWLIPPSTRNAGSIGNLFSQEDYAAPCRGSRDFDCRLNGGFLTIVLEIVLKCDGTIVCSKNGVTIAQCSYRFGWLALAAGPSVRRHHLHGAAS